MKPLNVPVSPTGEEITVHLKAIKKKHPKLVKIRTLRRTKRGRPIEAATFTDPDSADSSKQHVLILAGRHGNEESPRMQALAIMDWLVTPAAAETVQKQKIVVMPNLNPDAAHVDSYWSPDDVNVCADLDSRKSRTPEDRAFEEVVSSLQPDAVIDMHARGHAGCSYDMVLSGDHRPYTEDHNVIFRMVQDMVTAGEKAGAPHLSHPMSWPGWVGFGPVAYCYKHFKSLSVLTETPESNTHRPDARVRIRTGLERVKALLKWGNRDYEKVHAPGYPSSLVLGSYSLGIASRGKTARQRRASRIEIWSQADHFERLANEKPEKQKVKGIAYKYKGAPLKRGLGIQTRSRGRMKVREVTLNGRRLRISETNGYVTWQDQCSTYVVAFIPAMQKGTYKLGVMFE